MVQLTSLSPSFMDCLYTEWSASETGTYHVTCLWKRRLWRQSSIHSVCDAYCVNIGRITLRPRPATRPPCTCTYPAPCFDVWNLRLYAWWDVSKYCPPAPGLSYLFSCAPFPSGFRPPSAIVSGTLLCPPYRVETLILILRWIIQFIILRRKLFTSGRGTRFVIWWNVFPVAEGRFYCTQHFLIFVSSHFSR